MNIRRSLLATAVATVSITASQAATLTWDHDADGTASDGSGNWLDANKWLDGVTPATWNNATPDSAIIGSGGTGEWNLELGAGVTVADATFDNYTGEYRLRNGSLTIAPNGTLTWGPSTGSNGEGRGGVEFESSSSLIGDATTTIVIDGSYPSSKESDLFTIRQSNNTGFDGTFDIRNGVLFTEVNGSNGVPSANSRIILNGGPGAGQGAAYSSRWGQTLDRDLGTGAGQIQVIGNRSGFDGQGSGGVLDVRLNGTGPQAVQWGDPNFDPSVLLLQTRNANLNGNVRFNTAVDLNGADRTIEVDVVHNGSSGGADMQKQISNSSGTAAGIIKTGPGRLILSDSSNDYDGPTVINEGILQIGTGWNNSDAIPGGINGPTLPGSNLVINNSQLAVYFTFTRGIGTAGNEVQFTGARAGITQRQGDRPTFVFGDSSTEVVWGDPGFDPVEFVINDPISGPSVNFRWQNPIDLNGADRTISTPSTSHGGTLEGDVRNTGAVAGLVKEGAGELILNGTNTYDGGTTINEGTVQFDKLVSMPANGAVTINSGTTLCVKVGGGGEWSTSGTGHGTVDGLLNGLGGQAPSTITNSGGNLCLLVSGSQTVSNVISSSGDFFVSGGTLELSGDNTFTGDVVIDNGATLILSGDNSGATGKIRIIDGFLELSGAGTLPAGGVRYDSPNDNPAIFAGSGAFAPTIGDGDDVYWNQNGGFAATDSAFTVTANGGATINWGANDGFRGRKVQLGSSDSTAAVEITNDINLDGDRWIKMFNNGSSSDDLAILSGDIVESGTRNLNVQGPGTLVLSGTNVFGASNRRLELRDNAVVRAADGVGLPTIANLYFRRGVLETSGSFTRDIGNQGGEVYWENQGGFAAQGGPLNVNLESDITINWGDSNTGFRGQEVYMGSETADNVVTLENDIELRGNRNLRTFDNPNTDGDYTVLSGVISNGDGNRNLEFRGNGTVLLNGDNTYTGETRVHDSVTFGGTGSVDGKLRMEGSTKLSPGASVGTFGVAGNLEIDPLAGNSNGKLLFELGPIAASDKIEVDGQIIIGGGSLDLDDFEFTELAGLENGTYVLISGGSPVNGSLGGNTNGTLGAATIDLQISASTNDIELVVSGLAAGSPFDTWAGTGSLGPVTFDGDTNGDGVQDGIAFLLGVGNPDDDANGNLPAVSEDGSGNLVMTFECLAIADRGTATLNVQHSSDLAAWAPLPNGVLVPDASGGPTDGVTFVVGDGSDGPGGLNGVTATIDSSLASGGKLFGRLNGTE